VPRVGVIAGSAGIGGTAADGTLKPCSRSDVGIELMLEPGVVKGYEVIPGPLDLKIEGPDPSGERRTIISRWKLMRASRILRLRRMNRSTAKRIAIAMNAIAPMMPPATAGTLMFRFCGVDLMGLMEYGYSIRKCKKRSRAYIGPVPEGGGTVGLRKPNDRNITPTSAEEHAMLTVGLYQTLEGSLGYPCQSTS